MILCFYRQKIEAFKEKHKIIDVPFPPSVIMVQKQNEQLLNDELIFFEFLKTIKKMHS